VGEGKNDTILATVYWVIGDDYDTRRSYFDNHSILILLRFASGLYKIMKQAFMRTEIEKNYRNQKLHGPVGLLLSASLWSDSFKIIANKILVDVPANGFDWA
jgi:hypothetical protein